MYQFSIVLFIDNTKFVSNFLNVADLIDAVNSLVSLGHSSFVVKMGGANA